MKSLIMTHLSALDQERESNEGNQAEDTNRPVMRESGIPPAHLRPSRALLVDRTAECIETALAESARTEANLNLLLRGLEQIVAGASASRESNSMLSRELDTLRDALARSGAEEMALRQRVRLLEQAVERSRRDAALERAFFLEQEDAFLAEMLTDHEREVAELRQRLVDALRAAPPPFLSSQQSGTIPRGPARKDTDPVFRKAPDTMPPASSPASGAVAVVRLGTLRIPRPSVNEDDRPTPVPPSKAPSSPRIPAVVQKPDIASRPLVGYSLKNGEVAEEHVETPTSSRRT